MRARTAGRPTRSISALAASASPVAAVSTARSASGSAGALRCCHTPATVTGSSEDSLDDLERIERARLEAGGDLDQQRHDAEPRDGQGDEVVAREHRGAAVEIGDAHRDARAGRGELVERLQRRCE